MRMRGTQHPLHRTLMLAMLVCLSFPVGSQLSYQACAQQDDIQPASSSVDAQSIEVDYERDIQPLFQQRCYSCHGPEGRESGLRIDQKQAAMVGGDRGGILVAGSPDESRLIDVLTGDDEDVGLMPPDGVGTPFSEEEIELVRTWIAQGAAWPDEGKSHTRSSHWAFQSFTRPQLPTVKQRDWVQSPIDVFVLARLESEGIAPSRPASRSTLARRLYLDLLGLPPTPAELEQFLADQQPGAYERLVDRVLASPHFGERWGRHWLDLARYADTDGYEKDRPRPNAWRYRDWVIDAINQDLSFADFSRWQIAGDMIPNASAAQRVASGFHRNTLHNTEGGIDPEEDRFKKTIDRTNTFGAIWLGMTVGCAQCHSHKYDPLTQREYYSLFAYFNQIDEAEVAGPVALDAIAFAKARQVHQEKLTQLQSQIASVESQRTSEAQSDWEERTKQGATVWQTVTIDTFHSRHGAEITTGDDGQSIVIGPNEKSDFYRLEASVPLAAFNAIRLEVLPSPDLPKQGPGRADNGNFVLAEFSATWLNDRPEADALAIEQPIKLADAITDFAQQGFDVRQTLNGDTTDGWAVSPRMGQRHVAVFKLAEQCTSTQGRLRIELDQSYPNNPHNLGSFRISVAHVPGEPSLEGIPDELAAALLTPRADRDAETQATLNAAYKAYLDQQIAALTEQLQKLNDSPPSLDQFRARGIVERQPARTNMMYVRGDFLRPGDAVQPHTPRVLENLDPATNVESAEVLTLPNDRRELADWLFHPDHPLTSRVTANRIWYHLFGRGLVTTLDDFGMQSDPPSHPELLDWLACELRENDWSVKQLIRRIVLSSTYRQRADYRTDLVDIDPNNRLLARQNRRRVEAEIVRDLALAAAGLLDDRIGGPSVRPPQPDEYSSLTYADSAKWQTSPGGDAYRRGMYTFFQRTSPYPMLTTFDCPDSNQSATQRNVSNTPIQSLTLWNDPVFFASARALADRVLTATRDDLEFHQTLSDTVVRRGENPNRAQPSIDEDLTDSVSAARIRFAYRCCLSRDPTQAEIETLKRMFDQQKLLLAKSPGTTGAIVGETGPPPAGFSNSDVAAWVMLSRTLINLDEFIMKE